MTNVDKVAELLESIFEHYIDAVNSEWPGYVAEDYKQIAQQIDALYGGWVSVDERLPDLDCVVWGHSPNFRYSPVLVAFNGDYWSRPNNFQTTVHVTHWQPLPEPPNE